MMRSHSGGQISFSLAAVFSVAAIALRVSGQPTWTAVVAIVVGVWAVQNALAPSPQIVAEATLDGFPAHEGARGVALLEEVDGRNQVVVTLDATVPDDGYREVWLLADDGSDLVSLGVLEGSEGVFDVPADVDLAKFSVVDVSQEADDGDQTHSGDSIVRGALQPA